MLLTFGKHKGKTVETIWDEGDESYLLWLHDQDFVKKDHLDIWSWLDNMYEEIKEDHEMSDPLMHMNWYDMIK